MLTVANRFWPKTQARLDEQLKQELGASGLAGFVTLLLHQDGSSFLLAAAGLLFG